MFTSCILAFFFVWGTAGQKIVLTNDDGWAVAQIRAQFDSLEDAGYNVDILSPLLDVRCST